MPPWLLTTGPSKPKNIAPLYFLGSNLLLNFLSEKYEKIIEIFEKVAKTKKINLQRSVASGILTDASYVQFANEGIASIDVGFPMRYSHSSREVCNLNDLIDLKNLLVAVINKIDKNAEKISSLPNVASPSTFVSMETVKD